ncbi:MAG: 23S rRNA pseudouridine1911/1915/1917 synthase [Bradymonadia bacterium]|jgi:23S rRNA pseudouridine1911/1915/1917 synthase
MKTLTTDAARLDVQVKRGFALSNNKARNAIHTGKIFVDDVRVTDIGQQVPAGAQLRLEVNAPNPVRNEPQGVRMLFRDDYILVLDKPSGLLSSPLPNDDEPSALTAAQSLCKGPRRPKIVHRLDRDTSGLLVFARGTVAARQLQESIKSRTMHRTYACVTDGTPVESTGMITSMLVRDRGDGRRGSRESSLRVRPINQPAPGPQPGSGRLAVTRYEIVAQKGSSCALEVRLGTGRTHQIRIHLAEIRCPLLGERVYERVGGAPRQALHAMRLAFPHPATGKPLSFRSPWPVDLADMPILGPDWQD